MSKFPKIESLLPHSAPMILVDKLIYVDEDKIHSQVLISKNSPFFIANNACVGAWVGIEYMAQTIAAWSGYQHLLKKEASPIGFLLGTRRYHADVAFFKENETLDIYAQKEFESEGMGVFSCSIECRGEKMAQAQLNVFVPHKALLKNMLKRN
ncbi:3-hydroxydecanoyl-[ACP] dehydratase [Psychromonas sp. CNPT3]|uniref:ApeP family dehydratase n=1 Tax=Psychromonas sp. CNPT3 TaxID=314282 RepID=UPI00006E7917|nr:hotdog family protein [Psychromonas sp. CNPT3]AGH79955.1 3-hydroxydecanoyl-[ACP] dehydratase [Psychromonas sp. CNPT3]